MLETYKIPLLRLGEGKHLFYFAAGKTFFEHFDFHNITEGDLKITVCLEKQPSRIVLDFNISGRINTICDICLDDIVLPIEITDRLFVKFSKVSMEQIDENITIGIEETEINIAHNIYEIIELNLPNRRIHSDNDQGEAKCNIKMIDKINKYSVKNEIKDSTDPRWEKLKNLKL